ncbi:hypothetical protein [Pseudomonas sp. Irchel 3A5]|jgi:hypothetical protein|uniref:hypothetical protein n=1 Tax=Pseudomonas sp. Irchel 3A5 TaxID=2008911 RepID=UPI001594F102|nr:hypothetical protein [Pseudomonas sp. Irchel 3A5]
MDEQITKRGQEKQPQAAIFHCSQAVPEGKCSPFSDPFFSSSQEISDAQPS